MVNDPHIGGPAPLEPAGRTRPGCTAALILLLVVLLLCCGLVVAGIGLYYSIPDFRVFIINLVGLLAG
ncbi:MAG: hypothetical protein ACUVWB_00495 [Anaerolineae bacterium]